MFINLRYNEDIFDYLAVLTALFEVVGVHTLIKKIVLITTRFKVCLICSKYFNVVKLHRTVFYTSVNLETLIRSLRKLYRITWKILFPLAKKSK